VALKGKYRIKILIRERRAEAVVVEEREPHIEPVRAHKREVKLSEIRYGGSNSNLLLVSLLMPGFALGIDV